MFSKVQKRSCYRDRNIKETVKEFLLQHIVKFVTKEKKEYFIDVQPFLFSCQKLKRSGAFRVASFIRDHLYLISIYRLAEEDTGFIGHPVLAWALILGSGLMVQLQ